MPLPDGAASLWRDSAPTSRLLALVVAPLLAVTIAGLIALWPKGDIDVSSDAGQGSLVKGEVVADQAVPCDGGGCHLSTVRLTSGPEKGTRTILDLVVGPDEPPIDVGDRIVLGRTEAEGEVSYHFADFQRRTPLLWLAAIYVVVVIGIGRLKGLTALIGVVATFALLSTFVLPSILEGNSPLAVAIVGSAASMFVILYLAHGLSAKTSTALLGTLGSLAITGALAALFVDSARLLNIGSDETAFLRLSAAQVNLQGLLLGGIIIGSLGVLNDVTITQASTVWALRAADPTAGFAMLYRSAMRVGRDHIASTVDTLVLAYAGASLPLLLLFTLVDQRVSDVVTGSVVAEEIVRTLVGGIGLAASVPITTALAALVVSRTPRSGDEIVVTETDPPGLTA